MAMTETATIRRLRRQVNAMDQKLIRLLGKRFSLTNRIGARKRYLGRSIRDVKTEAAVMKRALRTGRRAGLQTDLIQSVFQTIIAGSRHEQQKLFNAAPVPRPERILVIGGAGDMGRWLVAFLARRGHRVAVYDPKCRSAGFRTGMTLDAGVRNSDLVLISVPLDQVGSIIDRLAKDRYHGIVCDIASVKGHILKSLRSARRQGLAITSIHPLFGPGVRSRDQKTICLCACGCRRADNRIRALFRDPEIAFLSLNLNEHDRLISYVLGLSHLVNIVFGELLVRSGYSCRRFEKIASTTFRRQLDTARSVLCENPRLYYAIQRLNPYRNRLYADLDKNVRRVTKIILGRREAKFIRLMDSGRDWLSSARPAS
jgi:chorismate mutase/prephenate dehydrogenase